MAAPDDSEDQDALYVLTAALLTPARFPAALGDDYPESCAALGLDPYPGGYGLVIGQDSDGARWTVVVDDVSLVAVAIASWDCGMEYDLSPGERTVVSVLPGWPLDLAVAAPGLPAPHDPAPEPEPSRDGSGQDGPTAGTALRLPLAPPDTGTWGPPQRRLGADEIALHWTQWRDRTEAEDAEATGTAKRSEVAKEPEVTQDSEATGTAQGADAPGESSENGSPSPGEISHPGIRRVLGELRAYLHSDTAPPLGRVRSGFAPDGARMLRADGPGWSFVARTDDMAFVLLDEEPGEVLPVGRGSELPPLLKALDAMAVRPA
ncbi:hypothetical protein [Streptomyces corynorhini]|uniref:Integral membrane protein n=1 Tax=Streptomyces corynorhini TaxID=2282652 RepID=A0A370BG27_9ACTN|nr:hypothetical protein [Streptomyces corynorhini]RDG38385.1 hypothetical protein DVH02_09555 [Streptomyces corynorhini]